MAQTQLPAVQIKDNDIKNVDIAADAAIAFSKLAGVAASSHVHSAADVTTGQFLDARIKTSSVTQYVSSIDHDALLNFVAAEHINWAAASAGTIHIDNYIEGGPGKDTTAIHDNVGAEIFAIANKIVPDPLDVFITEDEGDGYAKTRVTFAQVEAALDHDSLSGFVLAEHVNWAAASAGTIHVSNYIEGGAGTDTTAIHDNVANEIASITNKATPIGADYLLIEDSIAANAKKYITITNLEAMLDHDALSNFVSDEHINWTNSQAGMRFIHNDNINGIDATVAVLDGNGMQTHNFVFTNGILTSYSLT